jgi:hypothetical protein
MFGKYNGFVSKARVSACMYFLVQVLSFMQNVPEGKLKMIGKDKLSAIGYASLIQ